MICVLAYYCFTPIEQPLKLIQETKRFLDTLDAKGRIYINEEGVNGQISLSEPHTELFIEWMHEHPMFKGVEFKVHLSHEHAFAKMVVKYRKQLVAIDQTIDLSKTGKHLSPKEWKAMIENKDENTILIDVRNQYEWAVGYFEGAILPNLDYFRDFPKFVEELKKVYSGEKPKVMMYCTGGIRCELYSSLMMDHGFDSIYQLQGGVIKYGLEEGKEHWRGKLFVFDDRMVVPISSEDDEEIISQCLHCKVASDTYYNCANMDCNELFLSCPTCAEKMKGCCCDACIQTPRVRPFVKQEHPKPFRKLSHEEKTKFHEHEMSLVHL